MWLVLLSCKARILYSYLSNVILSRPQLYLLKIQVIYCPVPNKFGGFNNMGWGWGRGRKLRIIYKSGVVGVGRGGVLITRWGWKFLLVIYFLGARRHNNVGGTKTIRSIKHQTVIVMEDFWKTVKDKFKTWKALFVLVIA